MIDDAEGVFPLSVCSEMFQDILFHLLFHAKRRINPTPDCQPNSEMTRLVIQPVGNRLTVLTVC
jgi:hypothetical protein